MGFLSFLLFISIYGSHSSDQYSKNGYSIQGSSIKSAVKFTYSANPRLSSSCLDPVPPTDILLLALQQLGEKMSR